MFFDNQNSDIGGRANTGMGYTGGFINRQFLGNFSWGRIELQGRSELNQYPFFGENGVLGINTGSLVTRTNSLNAKNYDGVKNILNISNESFVHYYRNFFNFYYFLIL